MERMVAPVIEAIWRKVVESFSSRVVEQTVDNALNSVNNVRDFGLIFENLQKNLRALSAKAADVEEEITNRERSGRKKRKREVKEWLEQVESIKQKVVELGSQIDSEGFVTRLTVGGEAAQLDEQVKELVEQSRNFGELVLDVCGTRGETLLTNGMVGSAFDENLERILRLLERREVESIGVYGMGGVGKTTLAKHIHNRLLQQSQGDVFWITVSQEFTIRSLQNKIARFLGVDLFDEDEEDIRAATLNRVLSQKKDSVLILDDVWDGIDLREVGCPISVDCCRLIITTRSPGVCRQIGCQKVIRVGILKEGEAWKLFKERLGIDIELDPEVERIAKSMVKLCDGLPLGIITVAGSMKGKAATKATWEDAHIELKEHVVRKDRRSKDKVFEILKYSFDWLKGQDHNNGFNMIQRCFLYCSLYPEDHEIDRDHLVRELISDGLVSGRESRRARVTRGLSILDELVNVCLLEKCVNSRVKECVKMHDLVRDMALKISEGKYMVRAGEKSLMEIINQEEWTKDIEKVSYSRIWRIDDGGSPNCPNLSTLLLRRNPWNYIPVSFFSKMQNLCTLDLCGNFKITMLPDSISDMTSLKALLLEGCLELEKVPYLGKMKELRELNLSGTAIKEAPRGLDQLLKLEFLSLKDANKLGMIPSGLLQKLVRLQHVSIPFHIKVPMGGIQNLKLLEEFHGWLERVEDFNSFMRSGEGRRERDNWYTIIVKNQFGLSGYSYSRLLEEIYLYENLPYKKKLGLCGCNLEEQRVLCQDTEYVMISDCKGLSISFLDDFSGLKRLQILFCKGIEWILRSDCQFSNTLEIIYLAGMDNLKGVVMERPSTQLLIFSSLRKLTIENCNKMRKVGLPSALPNLEEISIKSCKEIEEIFEEDEGRAASILTTLTKLKQLRLCRLPRWKNVGLSVSRVPNLECIDISWCEEIEEIFKEDEGRAASIVTTHPKLQTLHLQGLPRLKKVGLQGCGLLNLEKIEIKSCGEIKEIFEEGRAASILTTLTLPKLDWLFLQNLPRVKRVSKATIISNSIRRIKIRECPRLMKKLPLRFDNSTPPSTLQRIEVEREWWESLEWDIHPNLPQLLEPFLQLG